MPEIGEILAVELDALIRLLERDIPANPSSISNEKRERALQKELADYFKALEQAFPYGKLGELYYRHVKPD